MCTILDKSGRHIQVYPQRPDLTIAGEAEHYKESRRGRGPTHVDAYKAGARRLAYLILEGHIQINQLCFI